MPKNFRYRLQTEITDEQYFALQKMLMYGQRRAIFSRLVDDLISLLEVGGQVSVGAILSGKIGLGYNKMEDGK